MKTLAETQKFFADAPPGGYDTITSQTLFRVHILFAAFAEEVFHLLPDNELRDEALNVIHDAKNYSNKSVMYGKQAQVNPVEPAPKPEKKRGRPPGKKENP